MSDEPKLCKHLEGIPFAEPGDECPECAAEERQWVNVESKLDLVDRLRYHSTLQGRYEYLGPPHQQPCRCLRCLMAKAADALVEVEDICETMSSELADEVGEDYWPYERQYSQRKP